MPEQPTDKTFISKDRYPSSNSEIVESIYFSNNSHHSVNKKSPAEMNLQENQTNFAKANDGEKNVKELSKPHKNDEEKVSISNEHCRNGTTSIMGDSTVSGLMEKKISRNQKVEMNFFLGAKIRDSSIRQFLCLKKTPDYIILNVGTNVAPCKADLNISNEILE